MRKVPYMIDSQSAMSFHGHISFAQTCKHQHYILIQISLPCTKSSSGASAKGFWLDLHTGDTKNTLGCSIYITCVDSDCDANEIENFVSDYDGGNDTKEQVEQGMTIFSCEVENFVSQFAPVQNLQVEAGDAKETEKGPTPMQYANDLFYEEQTQMQQIMQSFSHWKFK